MVILYGWKTYIKKEKELGKKQCENCKHNEETYLAKEVFRTHIFGIPVFAKTKRRFVMCNNCGIIEELGKQDYNAKLKEI